jgi:hypothetical protein
MQHNGYYQNNSNLYEADVGGATDAYGQHQQYEQYGFEQTGAAAASRQGSCVNQEQWQQAPPYAGPQLQHQHTHAYGQTMSAPSAAAYGLPMPQQVMQAALAPDQHDDTLKAVRDMPAPFQQLYSYR